MTRSLIISAPIAEANALNEALEAAGKGPGNLSVPMLGDAIVELGQHTHLGCHWWATEAEVALVRTLQGQIATHAVVRDEPAQLQPRGLFDATFGDYVQIEHKEFTANNWGWRAVMHVASSDFSAGVRAVAIYTDAAHQNYSYTTGAFVLSNGVWATEWNEGKATKADVHWAVLFASLVEVAGTLTAVETVDIAYMRYGLPPNGIPTGPSVQPWVQPTGGHDAYALGARVTHNGQTWESTINANVWAPGTGGLWVVV